jgi:DNA repair exonuclease SbcCD ATPase subunit
VPCGSNYLTSCKFIKDAHAASAQVSGVSDQLVQLTEARAGLENEILSLDIDTAKEHIKKYKKLLDKKTATETDNVKLKLDIERNNNSATSLRGSLSECEERIAYYHENQDAIENLRGLKNDKVGLESEISTINTNIEACEESLLGLYKSHGSLEREVEILKSQESDLQELRGKYEAYDLYMKCMHSNGIAYDIIKKRLPIINNEIAKVMANIVDFDVFLEDDGKKLDILIKHPKYEARPLELGSGAEKTISSMAIRMALLSVSSLPKGNIFILDEPGTALDEDNMEGFVRLLDIIKTYFKTVLLISHLDSLKDCVDSQVSIERNGKFAFVNH